MFYAGVDVRRTCASEIHVFATKRTRDNWVRGHASYRYRALKAETAKKLSRWCRTVCTHEGITDVPKTLNWTYFDPKDTYHRHLVVA